MNSDLKKKLLNEQALTVEETLRLDEALESQSAVAGLVRGLEDESPSLAWRSALNEKLLEGATKRRKVGTFKWVSGVAATAAVTMFVFLSLPKLDTVTADPHRTSIAKRSSAPGLEESLVNAHWEADMESSLGATSDTSTMISGS